MRKFITLEEAMDILNSETQNLEIEKINLINSAKRVLAEDIFSKINNPPFNKSAMDGYAILVSDSNSINEEKQVSLKVIDEVFAGEVCKEILKSGEAIKIMTGAPIPRGANGVVKQEDVSINEGYILIRHSIKKNQNICFKGEDINEGKLLVKKGRRLDYADIGILASAGVKEIKVYRKPKIALVSTGDEVLDIHEDLRPGKIYNSNKYSLMARVQELGYDIAFMKHINDSEEDIAREIESLSKEMDLIITTGGASVGEKDLLISAMNIVNAKKLFWKIKIKPGSAVLVSKLNNNLVISLSGNPTAALTTFELLVRRVLEKLNGAKEVKIKKEKAILVDSLNKKSPQRRFVRGNYICNEKGQFVSITQIKSGNGILSSTLNSNCLIEIEAGNEGLEKGVLVDIIKL